MAANGSHLDPAAPHDAPRGVSLDSSPAGSERSSLVPGSSGTTARSSSTPSRESSSDDGWEQDADDQTSTSDGLSLCAESDDESTASVCSGVAPAPHHAVPVDRRLGQATTTTSAASSGPGRKVVPHSRERCRQQNVTGAFDALMMLVPRHPPEKKLYKHETLRNAIKYIKLLSSVLEWQQKQERLEGGDRPLSHQDPDSERVWVKVELPCSSASPTDVHTAQRGTAVMTHHAEPLATSSSPPE